MKTYIIIFITIISSCLNIYAEDVPAGWRKIYVSNISGDDSGAGTYSQPVKTLARAKDLAVSDSNASGFAIFLKGGENFTPTIPMTNSVLGNYDFHRQKKGFVWDLDKSLLITTYDNDKLAVLGPGTETSTTNPSIIDSNALQEAIAITTPCKKSVTIENLHIKNWELGAITIYQYKPVTASEKTLIRNNVIEKIGTEYFPDEVYVPDPNTGDLIYCAHAIQPRESSNIEITGNFFKYGNNQFDSGHIYLMDSFHTFYINQTQNVEIKNNIVTYTGGTPIKSNAANTYNIYCEDNFFAYTGPSDHLEVAQYGFVRCMDNASVTASDNYFYCPYSWGSPEEDSNSAYACMYSGSAVQNIVWNNNQFIPNYINKSTGSFASMAQEIDVNQAFLSRRYYDGDNNDFIELNASNWNPDGNAILPFAYTVSYDANHMMGLLNYLYSPSFISEDDFNPEGWMIDCLMYIENGVLEGYGHNATKSGWLLLDPPTVTTIFSEDFNALPTLSDEWTITYDNTSEANSDYALNPTGDSKLTTTGLTALNDLTWTTIKLIHDIRKLGDFHVEFIQEWDQNNVSDMPKLTLGLNSCGTEFLTVAYKDSNTVTYGTTQSYTLANETQTNGLTTSTTGVANWDIYRIGDEITIKLNDSNYANVTDARQLDRIIIYIQGKYMKNSSWEWTWDDYPKMSINSIDIKDENEISIFREDFNRKPLSESWKIEATNTTLTSWKYTLNDNDTMFQPSSIIPSADVKWTSIFLTQSFSDYSGDFHIDFDQTWNQNDVNDKPYAKLFLRSNGTTFATIGYQDESGTGYGYPHTYTLNNSSSTSGQASQNSYADWDIDRINNIITIKKNGISFSDVNDNRALDEIQIAFQGRYMKNPQWHWDSFPAMGIDFVKVKKEPNNEVILEDSFDYTKSLSQWSVSTTNVNNWLYTHNLEFDSRLEIADVDPNSNIEWTTTTLTKTIMDTNNFHIEFVQDWKQDSVLARPYVKLFLRDGGSNFATVGYQDSGTSTYGSPHVYTYSDSQNTYGSNSAEGTAKWDIYKIDGKMTILLNGKVFKTVSETHQLDEIKIYIQGKYMLLPGYEWTWPTMGIDKVKIEQII